MHVYVEATIKDVSKESFPGQNGETVEFYVNTLKNFEGEKLEVNSKDNTYQIYEGQTGVCKIQISDRDKGGYKLSLRGFKEGESIGAEEEIT
jgi:hypothetical protein